MRLLAWLGVMLATAGIAAAAVAQQPPPPGPAFGSTYRYQFKPNFGHSLNFCASQLAALSNNRRTYSFDFDRLSNPFLPPLDTPVSQFQAPPGWSWQPDSAGNSWLVSSPTPMPLNQEHCFFLPVTRRVGFGDIARIHAEDQNRADLYYFTSQQVPPAAKRGELPLVYTLPQQDVTGTFTSPSSACGFVRNFTTGLKIGVNRSLGTIAEPGTGDVVKGTVNPKTYTFKFTGATEVYTGGIKGLDLWASYGYTRTFGGGPCTAGYLAHLTLDRPGTIAPACNRPQIVAPPSVVFRRGRARFRLGARCSGRYFAGLRMRTRLFSGDQERRTGTFTSRASPTQVALRLKVEEQEPPRPKDRVFLELRSPAQMGLGPTVKLVEILFPR